MYSKEVVEGHVGAYSVADKKYDGYYLVKWEGQSEVVNEDVVFELSGHKFPVSKGDWHGKGV